MHPLRDIPSIDQLLQRPSIRALQRRFGREATVQAAREATAALRHRLSGAPARESIPAAEAPGSEGLADQIEREVADRLALALAPSLRLVINATGVVIHTNLGRAPLAEVAATRAAQIAAGYCDLEYDLHAGRRGARDVHAEALLVRVTGAEAAIVVNNNAAATFLILSALARGREVVVSRGELVEIGGGFRIPDIMTQSGAILREVGTTNKTRAADYGAAIGPHTALILRVHPSNFRIEGFTERPAVGELVTIGRRLGIPVVEDLGSGNLLEPRRAEPGRDDPERDRGLGWGEPTVRSSIEAGVDLVCFSGDKLLGGPQAGIVAGHHDLVRAIRKHPLMRALRVDKITYAALEATLLEYASGRATDTVPVARALAMPPAVIERRARAIADRLRGADTMRAAILDGVSAVGGGSAPGFTLPTRLLAIEVPGEPAERLEARLRTLDPPVIARIEHDRVVLDLRTVLPEQDEVLVGGLLTLGPDQ